jgi:prophage regulatory protein
MPQVTQTIPALRKSYKTPPQSVTTAQNPDALLKVRTTSELVGLSTAQIYRLAREKKFPPPIKLGARCTRFRAGDVTAWLQAKGGQA